MPDLIPCPACKREVSPEAPTCPGCGHKLREREMGFLESSATCVVQGVIVAILIPVIVAVVVALQK